MTRRSTLVTCALLALAATATTSPATAKPASRPASSRPAQKAVPTTAQSDASAKPESPGTRGVRGERRRIVGILDVKVEGVPREIAADFQRDLETQLDSREYWIAPAARVHELLQNSTRWTEGCVIGPCLNEVRTQTGADLVLLAAITGAGTSFGYVVTLVRTDTGQMLSQEASRCEVCTVNEALTNATLAAVKLLNAVPEELPDDAATSRDALARMEATYQATLATTKRRHSRAGLAALLTGLAAAGAGVALYYATDHESAGIGTAAAGGGLALGGVLALTF